VQGVGMGVGRERCVRTDLPERPADANFLGGVAYLQSKVSQGTKNWRLSRSETV
jgi:hypothetical protein